MLKVLLSIAQILATCFVARSSMLQLFSLSSRFVTQILFFHTAHCNCSESLCLILTQSNQRQIHRVPVTNSNQTLHLHIPKCMVYRNPELNWIFHDQIPYILEIIASGKLAAQPKCWILI